MSDTYLDAKRLAERMIRTAIDDIREVDVLRVTRLLKTSDPVVRDAMDLIESAKIDIKWSR